MFYAPGFNLRGKAEYLLSRTFVGGKCLTLLFLCFFRDLDLFSSRTLCVRNFSVSHFYVHIHSKVYINRNICNLIVVPATEENFDFEYRKKSIDDKDVLETTCKAKGLYPQPTLVISVKWVKKPKAESQMCFRSFRKHCNRFVSSNYHEIREIIRLKSSLKKINRQMLFYLYKQFTGMLRRNRV